MFLQNSSPLRLIPIAILALLLSSTLYCTSLPHDPPGHQYEEGSSMHTEEPVDSSDEMEAQRIEKGIERSKKNERWKNILVYTCFSLSLFILLWMRKKSKEKGTELE